MERHVDLIPLFVRQFEMCNVKQDEVVIVLRDTQSREDYVTSAATAARLHGAMVIEIAMPGLGWNLPTVTRGIGGAVPTLVRPSRMFDALTKILCEADFVVDLLHERMTHTRIRQTILDAGARIQTISEPPEILERLMCTDDVRADVLAMHKRFAGARELQVLSPSGTNVTCKFCDDRPAFYNYGVADAPGRWENWPTALVTRYPEPGSANGVGVIARGDIIFPLRRYASDEVTMTVEDGYVRSIDGGFDAELMRDFLEGWKNPDAYAVSHLSVGMHPNAWWSAMEFYDRSEILGMDGRSARGCFLFTTGPDRFGERYVEAHLDCSLRGCTVLLDGDPVVENGRALLDVPAGVDSGG